MMLVQFTGYFFLDCFFCLSPFIFIGSWFFIGEEDKATGKVSWDFFKTESIESSVQDITEDGERTSIEFERYFEKILGHAIEKNKIDKFVLVIDNLDRVDPQHAKNIWATLQTFFQRRSTNKKNKDWVDKLWFIVPFDREGFIKIWGESNDGNATNISSSFLKKCFQFIAEVPEPVMSAWLEYAQRSINIALEHWPEQERITILETFKRYASSLGSSPTPRDIKVLINQVGMLGMRWGGIMSAEAMCLYGQYRQRYNKSELRNELLDEGLPNKYESHTGSTILKMEIAGMLFGVRKEKGAQLLLSPLIKASIKNGDGGKIKDILTEHGDAFWIVWHSIRAEFLPSVTHTEEYVVATVNAIHDGLYDERTKLTNEIKHILDIWKTPDKDWNFETIDYSVPLLKLASLNSAPQDVYIWSKTKLLEKIKDIVKSVGSEKFNATEFENVEKLNALQKKVGHGVDRLLYSNLDVKNWSIWLNELHEYDVSIPEVLPARGAITAIASNASSNPNTLTTAELTDLIRTIRIYPDSPEWTGVSAKLVIWVNSREREVHNELAYELILRFFGSCPEKIQEQLSNALTQPTFWNRALVEDIGKSKSLPILASIIWRNDLLKKPNISENIKNYWRKKREKEELTNIFNLFIEYNQIHTIWYLASDSENILAIQIIKSFIDEALYSSQMGLLSIDEYSWADEVELEKIIKNLCKFGSVRNAESSLSTDPILYGKCIYLLNLHGDPEAKKFSASIAANLFVYDWYKCFMESNYLLHFTSVRLNW
ncbi:P-loop NTPase fold protein [Undibacterium sp. Ji50W]|uniref:P-loop NTPase fold protein n=1 Tax=Undibacterium sp. Ji50W TaxID=3413041 RepID=UPI003BF0688E